MKNKLFSIPVFLYSLMVYLFISSGVQGKQLQLFRSVSDPMTAVLIFIGIYLLCYKTFPLIFQSRSKGFYFLCFIVCGVFSVVSVMGRFFQNNTGLGSYISSSRLALPKLFLVSFAGLFAFFAIIQILGALRDVSFHHTDTGIFSRFSDYMFGSKCFLKSLILMAVIWLPQIIIRYPGALTKDVRHSVLQYWNLMEFTTQHPILYTVLAGKCMDLGISLGHSAWGFYLLILIQTVFLLLVLAYAVNTMNRFHFPRWLLTVSLIFFAFAPIFVSTATTALIDGPYNTFSLLLTVELVYYLYSHNEFIRKWYHYLLTVLCIFGLNFRHNGTYTGLAIIVMGLLMEIFFFIKDRHKIRYSVLILAVFVLPLFGGKVLSSNLYQQYNAEKYGTRAMLSLPIQQVSRCFATYGNEIDQDIQDAVGKVLLWDAEEYKEIYNPLTFDSIKQGYNFDATSEDIRNFLKAWLQLIRKYPDTCITATLNQNYFLFSPEVINQKYYTPYSVPFKTQAYDVSELRKPSSPVLQKASTLLTQVYYSFGYIPGLGLLVNQGFTDLVLITVALYALFDKNGRLLFLCVPLLLTLAIVFVGPMTYHQPRYTYPIMYCLPLLYGIFLTQKNLRGNH